MRACCEGSVSIRQPRSVSVSIVTSPAVVRSVPNEITQEVYEIQNIVEP
jgi:hypothetical protein